MMKKVLATVLVPVMCLGLLAGCGKGGINYKGEVKEGFIYETTGISPDAVMMTVNGVDVTAEEFFYWVGYGCSELSYYNGGIDWSADVNGATMDDYIKSEAARTAALYAVIKHLADENGVELSEEDAAAISAKLAESAEYYGGLDVYEAQMESQGVSLALMEELDAAVYLYGGLQEVYLDEGSKIHPSEDALNDYAAMVGAYTVKHALFDIRECSEEEAAEKLAKAEEIVSALDNRGEADLVTLFDGFISEYGEDPGMTTNPNGYTFKDSDDESLVPGFADACKALGENEYSDVLVTDYGYHVILRLPLDVESLVAEYFDVFVQEALATADIQYSDAFASASAQTYYEALIAVMEAQLAE